MENFRTKAAQFTPLPTLIDNLAANEPHTLWGEYPTSSTSFDAGFSPISYAQFAGAVNGIAHHVQKALVNNHNGGTLAYLAPNDARCTMSLVAAMKAGFKLLLTSERNSVAAHLKLFHELDCFTLVTTDPAMAAVQAILAERSMTVIELPSLESLLHEPQENFEYAKQFSEIQHETAFVVHTSGSTGLPKPMRISHSYIARAANNIGLPAPEGFEMLNSLTGNNRNLLLLPLGHPAGVHFGLLNPFFNRTTIILPRPNVPPTGETLLEMLKHTQADWATMTPLTLQTLSKNLPLLGEISQRLDMMLFSGGSLPKAFGDVLGAKVKLTSLLGSSESGPLPTMYPKEFDFKTNWNYLQIHPAVGAVFDPLPGDVAELVFKCSVETEPYQTVFTLFPDLTEFRTRDLFTRHPEYPAMWTHASRSDDIIVLLNGEKVNPVTFESHISKNPDVSGVIMFGSQRFEAGILIELSDKTNLQTPDLARVISRIWPAIEAANSLLPGYAQVSPSHICFTDPDAPILRTLKGTVRRKETLESYNTKIEQMYLDAEQAWTPAKNHLSNVTEKQAQDIIRDSLAETTKLGSFPDTEDLFNRGIDSLQALRLAQHLRLKTGLQSIQPSTVYLHPTVSKLSRAIIQSVQNVESSKVQLEKDRQEEIDRTLQDIVRTIDFHEPSDTPSKIAPKDGDQTVLLTGSTGSIGSYLLKSMMNHSSIRHIYCLNRSPDSAVVQAERNTLADPMLPTTFDHSKVTFLTADFSDKGTLGLSKSLYKQLQQSVTLLVHSAWSVNFNLPLSTFQHVLQSLASLIAFGTRSPLSPAFVFLSSVSAAFNYKGSGPVPEEILTLPSAPAASGYAESKHIAERLIGHAAHAPSMGPCAVLRLGQIAGPKDSPGQWNNRDWVPALVRSSGYLGMIPNTLNANDGEEGVDWLPIDEVAESILEIALRSTCEVDHQDARVYNLLNPTRTKWSELLPNIVKVIEQSAKSRAHEPGQEPLEAVKIVTPGTWLAQLRASATTGLSETSVDENPALKLMGLWEEIFGSGRRKGLTWKTNEAEKNSERLKHVGMIQGTWMEAWAQRWFERRE